MREFHERNQNQTSVLKEFLAFVGRVGGGGLGWRGRCCRCVDFFAFASLFFGNINGDRPFLLGFVEKKILRFKEAL